MSKKLLLITYYWPPAGGVAVQRWLHMSYHLAELGWEITVYHPKNPSYPAIDHSNNKCLHPDIKFISLSIQEPGKIYDLISPKNKSNSTQIFKDNKGWLKTAALKIRANQFIPDARMLWIKPSVKYLTNFLNNNRQDVMITNGTPHSCHVIGQKLSSHFQDLKWVADFRDPWMEIDYFEDLMLSDNARKKHSDLEKKVLLSTDAITTVSPTWAKLFQNKGAKKVETFTNGYSTEIKASSRAISDKVIISHVGTLNNDRNPKNLWKALDVFDKEVEINLVGPIAEEVINVTDELSQVSTQPKTVPHQKAIEIMRNSSALLLLNNQKGETKGRIPAKVFEYLALEKPIIYFGRVDNDAAEILRNSKMAKFYSYEDDINMRDIIDFINEEKRPSPNFIAQFSRKAIATKYDQFLQSL